MHAGSDRLALANGPVLALMRRWGALLRADPEDTTVLIATLPCR